MTITTYSSDFRSRSLLKGALRRNLGIGAYLTVAMAFFFPLQYVLELERLRRHTGFDNVYGSYSYTRFAGPANIHTSLALGAMVFILLAAPMVLSVVQNSYMHSRRAVDLYHSLPVTRGQLLRVNGLAVFLVIAIPLVLCYLFILAVGGAYAARGFLPAAFVYEPSAILLDLAGWLITEMAIIAVMMLVSVLVGSTFENFVFGIELLGAGPLLVGICQLLFQFYLAGYSSTIAVADFAYLSPAAMMICRYADYEREGAFGYYNWMMLLWLAAAVALFALACKLYRRRKSEVAQTPGVKGVLGMIIRAIAVFVGASAIGSVFTAFNGRSDSTFVVGVCIGGFLTILLIEAVLNRGFKGLKKAMPVAGALVAAVTILAVLLVGGGLGYETRLPNAGKVESVTINYRGRFTYAGKAMAGYRTMWYDTDQRGMQVPRYNYELESKTTLTSPEAIEIVLQYHQSLIEANINRNSDTTVAMDYENDISYIDGNIQYQLKGGEMKRYYSLGNAQSRQLLLELESVEEFLIKTNPLFWMDQEDITGIFVADRFGFADSGSIDDKNKVSAILEALRTDMDNVDAARVVAGNAKVIGYLFIETAGDSSGTVPLEKDTALSFSLPVMEHHINTISVLTRLGLESYLQQPSLEDMEFVGVTDYDFSKSSYRSDTIWQLSSFTPYRNVQQEMGEFSYRETDPVQMLELLEKASPILANTSTQQAYLYVTPVWSDRIGVSMVIPQEAVSQQVQEAFPYFKEKYGYYTVPETTVAQDAPAAVEQ